LLLRSGALGPRFVASRDTRLAATPLMFGLPLSRVDDGDTVRPDYGRGESDGSDQGEQEHER